METMLTIGQISELQVKYKASYMQSLINLGECWKSEGSYGRDAMSMLESGACMLPEKQHKDYYGNIVPSRIDLREGTKGTLLNCQRFWQKVIDDEIEIDCREE